MSQLNLWFCLWFYAFCVLIAASQCSVFFSAFLAIFTLVPALLIPVDVSSPKSSIPLDISGFLTRSVAPLHKFFYFLCSYPCWSEDCLARAVLGFCVHNFWLRYWTCPWETERSFSVHACECLPHNLKESFMVYFSLESSCLISSALWVLDYWGFFCPFHGSYYCSYSWLALLTWSALVYWFFCLRSVLFTIFTAAWVNSSSFEEELFSFFFFAQTDGIFIRSLRMAANLTFVLWQTLQNVLGWFLKEQSQSDALLFWRRGWGGAGRIVVGGWASFWEKVRVTVEANRSWWK